MSLTAPRPDLGAHAHATRVNLPTAVGELSDLLGAKLVAYICGASETRAVRDWATGVRTPRDPIPDRIRLTLTVAAMIADHDSPGVAQAWFQGLNPQLDDRSPARLIREGDFTEVGPQILAAARAFVAGG